MSGAGPRIGSEVRPKEQATRRAIRNVKPSHATALAGPKLAAGAASSKPGG
jgi:hypothetical protein